MGASFHVSALEPTIVKWYCYECGEEVDFSTVEGLEKHKNCYHFMHNFGDGDNYYIPVDYEVVEGELI